MLSDDSCQGQTTQTFAIIAYQFVFKLSGCREESTPCREEAARCFGAAAAMPLRPPTRPNAKGLGTCACSPLGPAAGPTRVPPLAHSRSSGPANAPPGRSECAQLPAASSSNPRVLPGGSVPYWVCVCAHTGLRWVGEAIQAVGLPRLTGVVPPSSIRAERPRSTQLMHGDGGPRPEDERSLRSITGAKLPSDGGLQRVP